MYFNLFFITTIIFTRIFLSFFPISSPKVMNFKIHHYMYGIILMVSYFFLKSEILLSIGYGLFLDELPCLILFKKFHYKEYFSKKTVLLLLSFTLFSVVLIN